MGDFVTDDGTNAAVIDGVIQREVKEWRLENARRKINIISGGIEVGVDRRRSHVPFGVVYGLTKFGEVAFFFKQRGRANIVEQGVAMNRYRGVIFPFIRVANLGIEACKFGQGFLPGWFSHPVNFL